MSTNAYLGKYSLGKNNDEFKATFYIPNNCVHTVTRGAENVYLITVNLAPGEKQPSTDLVRTEEILYCEDGILGLDFELPDTELEGTVGMTKKPRMRVVDLLP